MCVPWQPGPLQGKPCDNMIRLLSFQEVDKIIEPVFGIDQLVSQRPPEAEVFSYPFSKIRFHPCGSFVSVVGWPWQCEFSQLADIHFGVQRSGSATAVPKEIANFKEACSTPKTVRGHCIPKQMGALLLRVQSGGKNGSVHDRTDRAGIL